MYLIRKKSIEFRMAVNILVVCFLLLLVSCNSSTSKNKNGATGNHVESANLKGYPKFEFSKEIHKFGEISEGEIPVADFYFKNVGNRDLIISKIESNCGCANFKWDKKPIKVGQESKITLEFDSKGRYGKQYKVITIYSNTLTKTKKLYVSAKIK